MSCDSVTEGDTGTTIVKEAQLCGVVLDISDATTLEIIVVNEDGTSETLVGSFVTDGTDGLVKAISTATTWTEGCSKEQLRVVTPDGEWRSCPPDSRQVCAKLG